MKKLQEIVREFLDSHEWFYQEKSDELGFSIEVEDYRLFCAFHISEENKQIIFHSFFPIKIPSNKSKAVIMLLNNINCETTVGNFELDTNTGNVRYRTSLDVENTELNNHLLENMLLANFSVSVENYPQIIKLLHQKERQKQQKEISE
jgi:hypothetical protein